MNGAGDERPRIMMPMLAGIGNAVMAVPLVRELCRRGQLTIAARTHAIADVFSGLPALAGIEVLGSGYRGAWRRHRRIAGALRPELYVVPFPSNRWQYSLLAAASGAQRVVMHGYPVGGVRALQFLPAMRQNVTLVPAVRGIHDVVQNLRLLEAIDGAGSGEVEPPSMHVSDADRAAAGQLLRKALKEPGPHRPATEPGPAATNNQSPTPGIGALSARRNGQPPFGFVALQPGCGDTTVGRAKRWPVEKFAQLADELAARGCEMVIIEGPDERGVGHQISRVCRTCPPVIELSGRLGVAAALLEAAALYVGTDSGLAHVAAAVGTAPVTLFAAADPVRVAPFGYEHLVVTPPAVNGRAWQPRLMYPMEHPGPKLRSAGGIDWAAHIRVEDVLEAVERSQSAGGSQPAKAKSASAERFTRCDFGVSCPLATEHTYG